MPLRHVAFSLRFSGRAEGGGEGGGHLHGDPTPPPAVAATDFPPASAASAALGRALSQTMPPYPPVPLALSPSPPAPPLTPPRTPARAPAIAVNHTRLHEEIVTWLSGATAMVVDAAAVRVSTSSDTSSGALRRQRRALGAQGSTSGAVGSPAAMDAPPLPPSEPLAQEPLAHVTIWEINGLEAHAALEAVSRPSFRRALARQLGARESVFAAGAEPTVTVEVVSAPPPPSPPPSPSPPPPPPPARPSPPYVPPSPPRSLPPSAPRSPPAGGASPAASPLPPGTISISSRAALSSSSADSGASLGLVIGLVAGGVLLATVGGMALLRCRRLRPSLCAYLSERAGGAKPVKATRAAGGAQYPKMDSARLASPRARDGRAEPPSLLASVTAVATLSADDGAETDEEAARAEPESALPGAGTAVASSFSSSGAASSGAASISGLATAEAASISGLATAEAGSAAARRRAERREEDEEEDAVYEDVQRLAEQLVLLSDRLSEVELTAPSASLREQAADITRAARSRASSRARDDAPDWLSGADSDARGSPDAAAAVVSSSERLNQAWHPSDLLSASLEDAPGQAYAVADDECLSRPSPSRAALRRVHSFATSKAYTPSGQRRPQTVARAASAMGQPYAGRAASTPRDAGLDVGLDAAPFPASKQLDPLTAAVLHQQLRGELPSSGKRLQHPWVRDQWGAASSSMPALLTRSHSLTRLRRDSDVLFETSCSRSPSSLSCGAQPLTPDHPPRARSTASADRLLRLQRPPDLPEVRPEELQAISHVRSRLERIRSEREARQKAGISSAAGEQSSAAYHQQRAWLQRTSVYGVDTDDLAVGEASPAAMSRARRSKRESRESSGGAVTGARCTSAPADDSPPSHVAWLARELDKMESRAPSSPSPSERPHGGEASAPVSPTRHRLAASPHAASAPVSPAKLAVRRGSEAVRRRGSEVARRLSGAHYRMPSIASPDAPPADPDRSCLSFSAP